MDIVFRNKDAIEAIRQVLPFEYRAKKKYNIILYAIYKAIAKAIRKDGRVTIRGFGRFTLYKIPAHIAVIPRHKNGKMAYMETIELPEKYSIKFRPATRFKQAMDEGYDEQS